MLEQAVSKAIEVRSKKEKICRKKFEFGFMGLGWFIFWKERSRRRGLLGGHSKFSFCRNDFCFYCSNFLRVTICQRNVHLKFSAPRAITLNERVFEDKLATRWTGGLKIRH